MELLSNVKKSKTVKAQTLVFIAGLFAIVADNFSLFQGALTQTHYGILFILISMVNYYLRTITDMPLSDK